jgi:glycosyltransferase involved in cell wall biosynthesis
VAVESALHRRLNTYKKYLNKVIVPSRFYIEKFVEWNWPREKFVYIPNYVENSRYTPDFLPGDYFLYFGRLAPEKGVTTLLHAASKAGVKLKIAGTGPEESALHNLQGELRGDVEFLGYRSGESLHSLIRSARAVVLPSEWYENAPMSILESYASGKPVIGANIGGIPEMIEEGQTGWCFESGNIEALATVLSRVKAMPAFVVTSCGRAGRELTNQRFNRQQYVEAMLGVYSQLGVNA